MFKRVLPMAIGTNRDMPRIAPIPQKKLNRLLDSTIGNTRSDSAVIPVGQT
jgi:hypothetical protein